jgi:hypothetical protein
VAWMIFVHHNVLHYDCTCSKKFEIFEYIL